MKNLARKKSAFKVTECPFWESKRCNFVNNCKLLTSAFCMFYNFMFTVASCYTATKIRDPKKILSLISMQKKSKKVRKIKQQNLWTLLFRLYMYTWTGKHNLTVWDSLSRTLKWSQNVFIFWSNDFLTYASNSNCSFYQLKIIMLYNL